MINEISKNKKFFGTLTLSKKAQGPTGLVMAFGIIVLLILVVFFFSLIQANYAERGIQTVEEKVDDQITLLNYLRTPVDNENNIADLIVRYAQTREPDVIIQIQDKTKEILDPVFQGTINKWRVKLDGNNLATQLGCKGGREVSQDILLHNGNTAKVELIICG